MPGYASRPTNKNAPSCRAARIRSAKHATLWVEPNYPGEDWHSIFGKVRSNRAQFGRKSELLKALLCPDVGTEPDKHSRVRYFKPLIIGTQMRIRCVRCALLPAHVRI